MVGIWAARLRPLRVVRVVVTMLPPTEVFFIAKFGEEDQIYEEQDRFEAAQVKITAGSGGIPAPGCDAVGGNRMR